MKINNIFRRIKMIILLPIIGAMILSFILIYLNVEHTIAQFNTNENDVISKEMYHYLRMQDLALDMLESELDKRMEAKSAEIVQYIADSVKDVEMADLRKIARLVNLNNKIEDIYIIDTNGIVINTTFKKDLYLNFFDYGIEHKNMLLNVLKNKTIVNERFAIEKKTNRIKKYSYQPTLDGKYIVELGAYSDRADMINNTVLKIIEEISQQHHSVVSIELFMGADNPFSLNKAIKLEEEQRELVMQRLKAQKDTTIFVEENGIEYAYDYIYMNRENTSLYKNAVIRIISDRTEQNANIQNVIFQILLIIIVLMIVLIVFILIALGKLSDPIIKLTSTIKELTTKWSNVAPLENNVSSLSKLIDNAESQLMKADSNFCQCEEVMRKIDVNSFLCSISQEQRILKMVNSNNQSYIIHKSSGDGQADVVLFAGDGEIAYKPNDVLYVFCKAFVDLLDCDDLEMLKQFHNELLLVQYKSIDEQKSKLCAFINKYTMSNLSENDIFFSITRLY